MRHRRGRRAARDSAERADLGPRAKRADPQRRAKPGDPRRQRARARVLLALACAGGLAAPLAGRAAENAPEATDAFGARPEPRCLVEASLDRERAFVGEQLHYHVRVLRRPDASHAWETPLSFPRARAEWLVGLATGGARLRDGPHRIALSEHRALFPAHPGALRVAGASVRCTSADGDEVVPVPAVAAEIEALPETGRPPGFSGLVGPVRWSAVLTPERVALGASARLSVVAIGSGNTWLAPSPAHQLGAVAELEVFERPPELARDAGRELVWRRYFGFDLVPHRAGRLALPELRLAHFDPAARAYAETRLALPALDVREGPAPAAQAAAPRERVPTPRDPLARARGLVALASAALAALLLAAAAAIRRRRRRLPRPALLREAEDWLREARAADARGDVDAAAAAAARALARALEGAAPGPWAERAAALLARLERGRFAPGTAGGLSPGTAGGLSPGAARPALADVEALLAARPR